MANGESTKHPVYIRTGDKWVHVGEGEIILDEGRVTKVISFTPIVPFVKPSGIHVDGERA